MKWFKHQSDARNSLKLRKVRRKYGADGYAIYWFCLEAIAYDVDKDNLTFDLKEDAETIAFELNIQEKRVEEIMLYMVETGLFESSQGTITCLKLAESIDKSMTNSPKMRAWIGKQSVMTSADCVSTCPELEVEVEVEKEVEKELKSISDSRFDEFYDLYGKKEGGKKAKIKFDKLSKKVVDKIFEVLPAYLEAKPDKKYRKAPLVWLNGEHWNDEYETESLNDCCINFELIVSDFNEAMRDHQNVPVAIKITDSQKKKINTIAIEHAMTNERYKSYFNHCATSEKFTFMINGINMPAQGIEYFMKEETLLKAMN